MKVYDNNQIKTYRSLFELANSNVLVGRKDGLIIGIDENTIQELRDTIDNNNSLHYEVERLNNIIDTFIEEIEVELTFEDKDCLLEHNTFITIHDTLEKVLKRIKELKEGK